MFTSFRRFALASIVALMFTTLLNAQETAVPVTEDIDRLPDGAMTFGVKGGDDYIESQLDVLIPLYYHNDAGLLFINPRASYNDNHEEELNFGGGYRYLFKDKNIILGGNIYYDSRWPESNAQFDQLGLGVEFLSLWVDARANYYLPEDKVELVDTKEDVNLIGSSSQTAYSQWADGSTIYERQQTTTVNTYLHEYFETYEGTLEGWDAEIGVRIPMPWDSVETRVFGGYYSFDPNIEVEKVEGWKGRLEVRALPAILLDAEFFEDDKLFGVDYLVGARVQVPCNLGNMFNGENPFKGFTDAFKSGKREFKQRLFTDQVMRDPHIQVRRVVEETLTTFDELFVSKKTIRLFDNVVFVDDSNISGIEDGSLDNPFDTIAEGLAAQQDGRLVFVFGGNYNESVEIVRNVMLIGEGFRLGRGRGFGSGEFAVITGKGDTDQGAAIRVIGALGANQVVIKGFDINNTGTFGNLGTLLGGGLSPSDLNDFVRNATGVLVENTVSFEFAGNIVRNTPMGITEWHLNTPAFSSDIHHNAFLGNGVAATSVAINSGGASRINNNLMIGNIAGVVAVEAGLGAPAGLRVGHEINNNIIVGGGLDTLLNPMLSGMNIPLIGGTYQLPPVGGIGILGVTAGSIESGYRIENNRISRNLIGLAGVELMGAAATYGISGNTFENNAIGAALVAFNGAELNFTLEDNRFKGGLLSELARPLLPAGMEIPDTDLMAVFVGSFSLGGTPTAVNGLISNNRISDHLIGITALGVGDKSSMDLTISRNHMSGSGLGALANIPAADIASFLAANPTVNDTLTALGIPGLQTLITDDYGLLGIGAGALMGSQIKLAVDGNLINNFALSAAAVAWNAGTIDLTLTRNNANSGGIWWEAGGTIAPLVNTGNNFVFTEL